MDNQQPDDGYDGPAAILGEGATLDVTVQLRGHVEPYDGRFHWYGRIAADPALDAAHRSGATVRIRTDRGSAEGRLSDKDPWGRFRIAGVGRPPF